MLPTFYENECFPLVILEGMMHGVACVSTDEGGIPDIVDDGTTGLIAHRQDAADLAAKLAKLLPDAELRQRMGEAGYAKYRRQFTLDAFEQTLAEALTESARGGKN